MQYAAYGWHLIPVYGVQDGVCACGADPCLDKPGKHPYNDLGASHATKDGGILHRWFADHPERNLGVVAGPSGLVLIDIDGTLSEETWAELLEKAGLSEEPETLQASSGRPEGGRHLYYQLDKPPGTVLTEKDLPGVSVRAGNMYVVALPSMHVSGQRYRWLTQGVRPAPLPGGLRPQLEKRERKIAAEMTAPARTRRYTIHQRGGRLRELFGKYNSEGSPLEVIVQAVLAENMAAFDPPKTEAEIRDELGIMWRQYHDENGQGPATRGGVILRGKGKDTRPENRRLAVVRVSDVAPEPVPWLWHGWIARGALTVVTGHPDVGKSWLTLAVAAALTKGWKLFGDPTERAAGQILLVGAEDPVKYVVRPRLDSLGADVDRVRAISGTAVDDGPEQHFSLVDDLDLLDHELSLAHYELVVIDPLNAYLADTDTHRDAAVRSVLSPLAALAERRDVAVLALIHPTKGSRDLPLYRIQGSVANSAACRTALLVGRDEATDGKLSPKRHVVLLKNNLMPDEDKPTPICFELTRENGFRWVGASESTAEDVLNGAGNEEEKTGVAMAVDVLEQVLADGAVKADDAKRQTMKAAGVSERTVWSAKKELGVVAEKVGFDKATHWTWRLPDARRLQEKPEDCKAAAFGIPLQPSAAEDTDWRSSGDIEPCPGCGKQEGYDEVDGQRTCADCGHQWAAP